MGSTVIRRLMAEYKRLLHNPPEGIIAGPVNQVSSSFDLHAIGNAWLLYFVAVEAKDGWY
jgi:hypothetical protein